jgi:hypothetical protein
MGIGSNSVRYVILHSVTQERNVLVEKDEFEDEGNDPNDYFFNATDAKKVGEISITGDTKHLFTSYSSS